MHSLAIELKRLGFIVTGSDDAKGLYPLYRTAIDGEGEDEGKNKARFHTTSYDGT